MPKPKLHRFTFEITSRIVETVSIDARNEEAAWEELSLGYKAESARNVGEPEEELVLIDGKPNVNKEK